MRIFILLVLATVVTARSSQNSVAVEQKQEGKDSVSQNLKKLKDLMLEKIKSSRSNSRADARKKDGGEENVKNLDRKQKSLSYYSYFPRPLMHLEYTPNVGYYYPHHDKNFGHLFPEEWLSRTEPFKRKNTQLLDSPTYYIRLPPNPYVFVPGVGYVSRPPSLNEPEILNAVEESKPEKPMQNEVVSSNFLHLPIDFVSNGKPTSVYQLPNDPILKPKPDSSVLNMNKGPYVFNGKPTDIYILRNSYNSLYADALTHFYP